MGASFVIVDGSPSIRGTGARRNTIACAQYPSMTVHRSRQSFCHLQIAEADTLEGTEELLRSTADERSPERTYQTPSKSRGPAETTPFWWCQSPICDATGDSAARRVGRT